MIEHKTSDQLETSIPVADAYVEDMEPGAIQTIMTVISAGSVSAGVEHLLIGGWPVIVVSSQTVAAGLILTHAVMSECSTDFVYFVVRE